MICLTQDTQISTTGGRRQVSELAAGDKVITASGQPFEVKAVRHRVLDGRDLSQKAHLKPILIRAGALGDNLPNRDTMVSPNQRLRVAPKQVIIEIDKDCAYVAAKHLVNHAGVFEMTMTAADYFHISLEGHKTVTINGLSLECFQPADWSLGSQGNAQRTEILELFPDLREPAKKAQSEVAAPEPQAKKKRFLFF